MGSCEDSSLIDEPSCDSAIEKQLYVEFRENLVSGHCSCSETGFDGITANVNDIDAVDGCLGLSSYDPTCCMSSDDVLEAGVDNRVGLLGECENVVVVDSEIVADDECGISGVCWNESQSKFGVSNLPGMSSILSPEENNVVGSCNVRETVVVNRDGLMSECENVAGLVLEKSVDDVCGVSLNMRQIKVDVNCSETDGVVKSLEGCEIPSGEMRGNTAWRNHDQQDVQKDDKEVDVLLVEGTSEVIEEKIDVLAQIKVGTGDQTSSFEGCGTPLESISGTAEPKNNVQQREHEDDKIVDCFSGEERVIEEKNDDLARLEKDKCNKVLSSWCPELATMTGTLRNYVQWDEQKDDKRVVSPSLEGVLEVMEQRTDALAGTKKSTCEQRLPSKCNEMVLAGSLRNGVHEEDLENDKNVGCPASEGLMEFMVEKTNTCDQMLPSQGCAMPTESIPKTFSPSNCIDQNEQKADDTVGEVMEGKNDSLTGTEKDVCEQVLSLQDCEIYLESKEVTDSMRGFTGAKRDVLVSSTGLSNNSTQHYQQKETESIGDPSVEEKADEFLSKLSCRDDLLGNCEGHNDQKDHNGFSFQDEEPVEKAAETKSNIDTYILALPVHSCQSSLENFHLADVINYTQQNEHSNNRSVDVPSTESVVKVMEQKSDVTTDVKLELCSQVIPMDESLKEHSSVIVPNRFGEKLVSLYSCLPSGVDENSSCNRVEVTDLLQKDLLFASSSSCAVDGSRQMDHRGKDDERVDCIAKTKFPDIISSYSRRSSRISRSSQKSQTKTVARDSRKTAKVLNQHGIIDIIFKVARQKRSCFSKRARSSIWGLLGNITQIFDKSDDNRFSQVQTQGLQKVRGGKGSRKRSKTRAGGSSVGSSSKNHSSTRCFRLKVKVGNKVCPSSLNVKAPEMFDTAGTYDHIVGDDRTSEFPQSAHVVEDKSGEEKCSDDSVADVHVAKELEGTVMLDKSAADVTGDHLENPTHKGAEILEGAIENNYVNPGTSPDSEVIDVIPEAQVGAKSQEGFDKSVSTSSTAFVTPEYITSSRRGKKKDNLLLGSNSIREDRSTVSARRNKAKPPKKRGGRQKKGDGFLSSDTFSEFSGANVSSNSLSTEEFYVEPLPSLEETDLGIIEEANVPSVKSNECPLSKSSKSDGMKKGRSDVSGSAKSRRKNACNQGGNQRKSVHKSRVKEKSDLVTKGRKRGACNEFQDKTEDHPDIGSQIADDIEKTESGNINASIDVAKMGIISAYVLEQSLLSESAWVRCDECFKWRRIPVALADSIDENCRWVCEDNIDKAFADCSTPQEKSNADINAELGLSDFEEDDCFLNYNGSLDHRSIAGPGSCFRRIDSNAFLHRSRKSQTIDEIMVCHCKPPLDGRLGCGDECLNRMLNIECVQGTCPCGDRCSNQQFQKRKYANMRWSRCGKKGFGLLLNDDISKGQFIIEYVGEVLDMQAYEARQKEYAANGHKHFYFMTLNGSEVIDACAKGNLGRFINHSCDPNCRTEKWMVNGEICIGLFALRDIKKDEELTFDYNYVRVFGAAAKKCHCGSPQCRGYIGGDPQNTEVIYQGDSDEEYPEPLMLEDGESGGVLNNSVSRTSSFSGDRTQYALKDKEKLDDATRVISHLEISAELEDHMNQSASAISEVHSSLEKEESKTKYLSAQPDIQTEVLTSKTLSVLCPEVSMEEETNNNASSFIRQVEMTSSTLMSSKLLLDGIDANRNAKSDTVEDKQCLVKSRPRIKTSRSSGSAKKGKVGSSQQNGNKVKMVPNKSQLLPIKSKKLVESSSNGRFEAVQEKLNELLDADGGISKRKDAPKGYLKLLLLTAASGDSGNGEAIQSNRDLSMILDALLKTKSRMVLLDIINKNGLQMLHNIMKQYRRDFKKIPILRKLLKVLEYLAVREILTRDHIVGGPPCAGMESFRESILSLTEHDDKQVHQIARNFRDKWIPKPVRKSSYMDRDDGRMDFQRGLNCIRLSTSHGHWHDQASRPSEAIDCVMQSLQTSTSADSTANEAGSAPCSDGRQTTGSTTRKRKSRWDQPAEADLDSRSVVHKEQKLDSKLLQQYEKSSSFTTRGQVVINHADMLSREESNCPDCVVNHYNRDEAANSEDGGHITHEDVPPGFSSPHNPPVSSDASSTTDLPQHDVAVGHPQEKFISRLPVSYGIPLHILQQFGPPQAETLDSWVIAPGMPFHPFPPLPPFPRDKKGSSPGCSVSTKTVNEPVGELQQDNIRLPTCHSEENNPSTTGANQSDGDTPCADIQQTCKRTRGSSNDLGRRYFRQQKRKGPPWLWRRNELRGSSWSQDSRVDKPSSNFYQRPSQQNHH